MIKFPIYQISKSRNEFEQNIITGVVKKDWIDLPSLGRCLLKVGDELYNEVWKEKIASELAASIGIPTANIEAIEREFIVGLFARIPDGWIKESQIAPAIELIDFNRQQGGFS